MNIPSNYASIASWFEMHPFIGAFLVLWAIVWKGLALWKAAELEQKYWFIVMLVLNTVGLLEIFYLFVIARRYKVEVIEG